MVTYEQFPAGGSPHFELIIAQYIKQKSTIIFPRCQYSHQESEFDLKYLVHCHNICATPFIIHGSDQLPWLLPRQRQPLFQDSISFLIRSSYFQKLMDTKFSLFPYYWKAWENNKGSYKGAELFPLILFLFRLFKYHFIFYLFYPFSTQQSTGRV